MTSGSDTIPWDRLSPPPREVSPSVAVRVRLAEIKRAFGLNQGFLRLWFLLVGVFLIIFGTAWYNGAKQEDHPVVGALLAAGGVGIVIVLFTLVYRRGSRGIELLRSGAIAPGMLTMVWVSGRFSYVRYETMVKEWAEFRRKLNDQPQIMSRVAKQLRDRSCKVRVVDRDGRQQEIVTRLNLGDLRNEEGQNPNFPILCNPPHMREGIETSGFYPGLTISAEGQWTVPENEGARVAIASFMRSFLPVVGTYLSAALGLTLFEDGHVARFKMQESPLLLAGIVPMLTVSHAVLPVFFFRAFLDGLAHFRSIMRPDAAGRMFRVYVRVFRVVVCLGMGVWLAVPAIALAYLTGWLSLAWAAFHVVLARRGTRAWTFITYGSSSMALLLWVVCFSAEGLFPLGIVVVVLQALLLTILDRFARHKWTSEGVR